jgi:hypothetical protein
VVHDRRSNGDLVVVEHGCRWRGKSRIVQICNNRGFDRTRIGAAMHAGELSGDYF